MLSNTPLDPATEDHIREDLREVAVLWADLAGRDGGPAAAARVAAEAEAALGPPAGPDDRPPARVHTAAGRQLLRAGDAAAAAREFEEAVRLTPGEFWPNFHLGRCWLFLGRHADALVSFHACVALAPGSAECWFNRGLAFAELGRKAEAESDYSRALTLDGRLAAAFLNRGRLHFQAGQFEAALADFQATRATGGPSAAVSFNLALTLRKLGRRAEAAGHARDALALAPHLEGGADLLRNLSR